jgi:hypothetical protein
MDGEATPDLTSASTRSASGISALLTGSNLVKNQHGFSHLYIIEINAEVALCCADAGSLHMTIVVISQSAAKSHPRGVLSQDRRLRL